MSKHTPGPWTAERFIQGDGVVIQSIQTAKGNIGHTSFGNMSRAECAANAALIAAAPDLLAACEAYAYGRAEARECERMMMDAIAKAKGRA